MGMIENRWRFSPGRRKALASLAGMFAASPLLRAQIDPHSLIGHKRVKRLDELVDAFDFEALCYQQHDARAVRLHGARRWQRVQSAPQSSGIRLGRHRSGQGRRSENGRYVVGDSRREDGVSPSSRRRAPDRARCTRTARSACIAAPPAANALAAFASGTSVPHQKIAPAATGPRWQQFYPIPDLGASAKQLQTFQDLGARAIIITVDQQASVYERDLHDRNLGGVVCHVRGGRGGGGGNAAAAAAASALAWRARSQRRNG